MIRRISEAGMKSTPSMRVVRLIPHEESFEVRVSTFFYFDDNEGRRSINGRPTKDQALDQAKRVAGEERAGDTSPVSLTVGDKLDGQH